MTPEQVREAAERLTCCLHHEITADDLKIICRYILATVHADDALPVTADWLREEWGWDRYGTASMHFKYDEWTSLFWGKDGLNFVASSPYHNLLSYTTPFPITTRHQFRQLAGALGIQPKKEAV